MSGFWKPGQQYPGETASEERETTTSNALETPSILFNPYHRLPLSSQRQQLPVYAHKNEILYAVETYATTILVGATGSGKTTQVPQYLMEAGWTQRRKSDGTARMIVCTQPRRLAATTIAQRVAHEVGTVVGNEVGYAVRFDEKWDPQTTRIKFCTDGLLLRETMMDPLLSRYSVIMLDEAHERNIETDLLMGLLRKIQRKRPELRVIIASATLDVDLFVKFFRHPHSTLKDVIAISVEARQYPVEIQYLETPTSNYLVKTVETILAIDRLEGPGDILVFLPGQEEIDQVVRQLQDQAPSHVLTLPLYANLPTHMQQQVFVPPPRGFTRKVIVATTIAETSLTIEGVVFVIDSCFVKLAYYNPFTGIESLLTTSVSQAAATQRAGRAGRTMPGKCWRLCTQEHYENVLKSNTIPMIQRTNLSTVVLYLLSMGIQDIAHFAFLSPPSPEALIRAFELLYALGAVNDHCQLIEPLGTHMAEFPISPMLAKILLSSFQYDCVDDVLSIASLLSVGDIFQSPRGSQERRLKISQSMESFAHADGDHLMYLTVYNEFLDVRGTQQQRSWCQEHMLHYPALVRATEIRRHLKRYLERFRTNTTEAHKVENLDESTAIRKCFVTGFFANAAKLHADGNYRTLRDQRIVSIHPTSMYIYLGRSPDWILYHESVLTTCEYIRDLIRIDPRWLVELAPDFYQTRDVSRIVSGDSQTLGLPSASTQSAKTKSAAATSDGRILFRKPTSKPKLPIHIGKSKGGLRSQF